MDSGLAKFQFAELLANPQFNQKMALCLGTTSSTKVVSSSGVTRGSFYEVQITVSALMENGIHQLLFVKPLARPLPT